MVVNGRKYYTLNEVAEILGRHRSTVWRWKDQGLIPAGLRYCDQHLLFSPSELAEAYAYANRLIPDDQRPGLQDQLDLFNQARPSAR